MLYHCKVATLEGYVVLIYGRLHRAAEQICLYLLLVPTNMEGGAVDPPSIPSRLWPSTLPAPEVMEAGHYCGAPDNVTRDSYINR